LEDFVGQQAVGLAMDGRRGAGVRSFRQAEDLRLVVIHPIVQVLDVVLVLDL